MQFCFLFSYIDQKVYQVILLLISHHTRMLNVISQGSIVTASVMLMAFQCSESLGPTGGHWSGSPIKCVIFVLNLCLMLYGYELKFNNVSLQVNESNQIETLRSVKTETYKNAQIILEEL